jgi:hypothetical protein
MRKWPLRILISLGALLLLAGLFWLWFKNQYEDLIRNYVLTEINSRVTVPISAKSAELHFWNSFPQISLLIKDIKIPNPSKEFKENENCADGMGKIGRLFVMMDIRDILHSRPVIRKIKMEEFCLALQQLKNGNNNYEILKTDTTPTQGLDLTLEKISFYKGFLSFENEEDNQIFSFIINEIEGKGNFSKEQFSLVVFTDVSLDKVRNNNEDFGAAKELKGNWNISGKGNQKRIITNDALISEIRFQAEGEYDSSPGRRKLELHFATYQTSISELLSLLPGNYSKWRKDYSGEGKMSLKYHFKWNLDQKKISSLALLNIKGASIKENTSGIQADEVSSDLSWKYESDKISHVSITSLSGKIGTSEMRTALEINLKDKLSFTGIAEGNLDLQQWNAFLKTDSLVNLDGRVKGKMVFSGDAEDKLRMHKMSGSIELSNVNIGDTKGNIKAKDISGLLAGNNEYIAIKDLDLIYNNTKIKGKALVPLTGEKEIMLEVNIPSFRLEDWEGNPSTTTTNSTIGLPETWKIIANIRINDYYQKKFHAQNISGSIEFENQQLNLNQISFSSLGGKAEGKGMIVFSKTGGIRVSLNTQFEDIQLNKLFADLNNFGQNTLTEKNISGTANAQIDFNAAWDTKMNVIDTSIITVGKIKVTNGELKEFIPLYSLSDYIQIEELKHIRFSALENQITIKDRKVIIPEMEIKSSALNLKCSGIHEFNQNINYRFSVLLNDILYKKYASRRKKGDAFGKYEEEVPEANTRIEIHMSGNVNEPKFEVDKKALKKEFASEMKREGDHLKKLLRDEVKGKGNAENEKKWDFEKSERMFELESDMNQAKRNNSPQKEKERTKKEIEEEKAVKKKNRFNFNDSEKSNPDYN